MSSGIDTAVFIASSITRYYRATPGGGGRLFAGGYGPGPLTGGGGRGARAPAGRGPSGSHMRRRRPSRRGGGDGTRKGAPATPATPATHAARPNPWAPAEAGRPVSS